MVMKQKYCDDCDITHYPIMCFNKPRVRLRTISTKTLSKTQATRHLWLKLNPPTEQGFWICYLNISPFCLLKLTQATLKLDHVKARSRYPELKYDVSNLRPACEFCNDMKGSRDLEELA